VGDKEIRKDALTALEAGKDSIQKGPLLAAAPWTPCRRGLRVALADCQFADFHFFRFVMTVEAFALPVKRFPGK